MRVAWLFTVILDSQLSCATETIAMLQSRSLERCKPPTFDILGPEQLTPDARAANFTKGLRLFGLEILGMSGLPPDALLHAGTVVAAYVDSDEDSCPDGPLVSRSMRQQNATLVMFQDPKEADAWFDVADPCFLRPETCDPGFAKFLQFRWLQDLYADETGYGACPDKSISCTGMTERDAALEECLHVISDTGYAKAYPSAFATEKGSQLAVAIETLYHDCEFSFNCTPVATPSSAGLGSAPRRWGRRKLRGRFSIKLVAESAGKKNCTQYAMTSRGPQWIRGSCQGFYHYADTTCDYACLLTEGFYWSLTSLLGGQDACECHARKDHYRCCSISDQWRPCTSHEMRSLDLAGAAYRLLAGLDPSRQRLGYVLPSKLPNGTYQGHQSTTLQRSCRRPTSAPPINIGCPNGSLLEPPCPDSRWCQ